MNEPLVLVIDVGNTTTALGLYEAGRVSRVRRRPAGRNGAVDADAALAGTAEGREIAGVVLASVVPGAGALWGSAARERFGRAPLIVSSALDLGMPVSYPHPETIGADRLANACGAAARYGTPVVVADFGTALTFDIVSATKGYVGGLIAPGLPLMFDYLAERTALLPRIQPEPVPPGIGKSTEQAMQIGARYGYRGMVRALLDVARASLERAPLTVCATGGYARWVLDGLDESVEFDSDITLYGLGRIYELNRQE